MKTFPRIKIQAPTAVFFILLAVLEGGLLSLIPFLAALCHEFGHLLTMMLFRVPVREIEITLFGAEIRITSSISSVFARIFIYFAGAAANIITGISTILIWCDSYYALFFCACSLTLAAVNLIPIRTLDGGCILEAVVYSLFPRYASVILDIISCISLVFLWLTAVYLMLCFGSNISLMLFCMYMFVSLYLR